MPIVTPRTEVVTVTIWCFVGPAFHSENTYHWISVEVRLQGGIWRAINLGRPWSTDFDQILYRDIAATVCALPESNQTLAWTREYELLSFDPFSASIFRSSLTLGTCRKAGVITLPQGANLAFWDNMNCISPTGRRLTSAVGRSPLLAAETGLRVFVDLTTNAQQMVQFDRPKADRARVCWLDDDHWLQLVASTGRPHFDVYSIPESRIVGQVPIEGTPLDGRLDVPFSATDVRAFAFDYYHPAAQTIRLPTGFPLSNLPATAGPSHTFTNLAPRDFDFLYSSAAAGRRRRLLVFRREPQRLPYLVEYLAVVVDESDFSPIGSFRIGAVPLQSETPPLQLHLSPNGRRVGFEMKDKFWVVKQQFK